MAVTLTDTATATDTATLRDRAEGHLRALMKYGR